MSYDFQMWSLFVVVVVVFFVTKLILKTNIFRNHSSAKMIQDTLRVQPE